MTPPTTPPEQPATGKKAPSKIKLGLDLVLGGFMLACSLLIWPYDLGNLVIAGFGVLWITGAAIVLDRHF